MTPIRRKRCVVCRHRADCILDGVYLCAAHGRVRLVAKARAA